MKKAQEAKEKTDMSNEKEAIQLVVINAMTGSSNDLHIDNTFLENNLNGVIAEGYTIVTDKYGNDIIIYTEKDIGGNYDELNAN